MINLQGEERERKNYEAGTGIELPYPYMQEEGDMYNEEL
jgi:hypothetical protein